MSADWRQDSYTFTGLIQIGNNYVPYYPVRIECNALIGVELKYYMDESDDPEIQKIITDLSNTFFKESRTDDQGLLFSYEKHSFPTDGFGDGANGNFMIPYIFLTRLEIYVKRQDATHVNEDYTYLYWDGRHSEWQDAIDNGDTNYYTGSAASEDDLIYTNGSNNLATRYVQMRTIIQNKETINVQDSPHINLTTMSWLITADNTSGHLDHTYGVHTIPLDDDISGRNDEIATKCIWCMIVSKVSEILGITDVIKVCNLQAENQTVCDNTELTNLCTIKDTTSDPLVYLKTDFCLWFCGNDEGNCQDALTELCESKNWNSEFIKDYSTENIDWSLCYDETSSDSDQAACITEYDEWIQSKYCGCYLQEDQYDEWYESEISAKGVYTDESVGAFDPRCIFGGCSLGSSKFDGWGECPSVTLCTNQVTVLGDLTLEGSSKLTLNNECGNNPLEDNEVDTDELTVIGNKFMGLDFAGEYTPYIIIATFSLVLIILVFFIIQNPK